MSKIYAKIGESESVFSESYRQAKRLEAEGYIIMSEPSPSPDHIAQEDRTWIIAQATVESHYQRDLATLDPLLAHILRHERNGEDEQAARAQLKFEIAQAEIMEKYGKGSTVFITATGDHYHKDKDCTALPGKEVKEVKLSVGLKNYESCTICTDNE